MQKQNKQIKSQDVVINNILKKDKRKLLFFVIAIIVISIFVEDTFGVSTNYIFRIIVALAYFNLAMNGLFILKRILHYSSDEHKYKPFNETKAEVQNKFLSALSGARMFSLIAGGLLIVIFAASYFIVGPDSTSREDLYKLLSQIAIVGSLAFTYIIKKVKK